MERLPTFSDLKRIAATVGHRTGWDVTAIRTERDPTPWEYLDVVRPYVHQSSQVLVIGTGGGERFLSLVSNFGHGGGIDPDPAVIATACQDTPASLHPAVNFAQMIAEALAFDDATFDLILNG